MKRLAMSAVLLVLLCTGCLAQGLYKLQYSDSQHTYDGLLVWYGPAQPSFMRIRFYEPSLRSSVLVEQQVAFIPNPDGFVLSGYNPRFLSTAAAGHSYTPDSFIFFRCPNGYFPCVTASYTSGEYGPVNEFREVSPYETRTFLQTFGFSTENNDSTSAQYVTMHLIVVADTESSDVGRGDEVDAQAILREFEIAAKHIDIAFRPTLISGSTFSKSVVLSTLNNLSPGPNDIVIFVFTGHGFRLADDTSSYPRLDLSRNRQNPRENNLSAWEVFQILKSKRSRLNITIVDACNSDIRKDKLAFEGGLSLKSSGSPISGRAATKLFLNVRANIIVASASKGELATTTALEGGYFIRSFLDAFRSQTSLVNGRADPNWEAIVISAGEGAKRLSRNAQTAIYHIE